MKIAVYPDLASILTKEIGPRTSLVVVEKLAGTTPKSAIAFLLVYPHTRYRIFNLADSSERYFERAEELCPQFGIDFEWFRYRVEYNAGVNLFKTKLSEVLSGESADVIVYWGPALICLNSFWGDKEKKYLKIFEKEKRHHPDDPEKRHEAMREFYSQHTQTGLAIDELADILADDTSCLKDNGRLLTNFGKDFERISSLMASLKMRPSNYKFVDPDFFRDYEKIITVWRKK
jgi:hypothetical protein